MSEIKLFEIGSTVKERLSTIVLLEKELQTTIEQNMETLFGVRFLKSEYTISAGRMDSIGIDENKMLSLLRCIIDAERRVTEAD